MHISVARQIAGFVWAQHFRIPEAAYWMLLVVAAVGFSADTVPARSGGHSLL
jgi:hypothetical protein